jgi:hypothetical protein
MPVMVIVAVRRLGLRSKDPAASLSFAFPFSSVSPRDDADFSLPEKGG